MSRGVPLLNSTLPAYSANLYLSTLVSPQIGLHGQEFPEDTPPPCLLSACPVEAGLVDLPGEGERGEPTEKLTLADTIAPHWFSPPEGIVKLTVLRFIFLSPFFSPQGALQRMPTSQHE